MRPVSISVAIIALVLGCCGSPEDRSHPNSTGASRLRAEQAAGSPPNTQLCVNLNAAAAEELTTLPGIGEVIAKRVIDYRERHGRFRRPEEIIIIEGFSERKYRAIVAMICVE